MSLSQLLTNTGQVVETYANRPTWQPAPSICRSLVGFSTLDEYPIRSPLAVADFLAPIVAGKSFCEIGTRNGDIMACLSHFASNSTAIEVDEDYCKKLRERGYRIICKPIEEVAPAELAHCEVYFWWPMHPLIQNEKWLRQMLSTHRELGTSAELYVAHDSHWPEDMEARLISEGP